MGQCLDKTSHSCGTRQGVQVFERPDGNVDGYCFSCDTYVRYPYGGEKSVKELPKKRMGLSKKETKAKIAEIDSLSCMDLPERRLRKDALEQFGIKIGLSEEDGKTPAFHHYPYTKDGEFASYKTRLIEGKRMWSVGDQTDVDLFGWEQAIATGAKRLVIVEGECFRPETEVLTQQGWVSLRDYDGVSPVMVAHQEGDGEFSTPIAVVDKFYTGELVEYRSGSYYSCTTPKHNLVRIDKKTGGWFKCKAGDKKKKHYAVPRTISNLRFSDNTYSVALAQAKVMISADFTLRKEGDLYARFKKARKVARCVRILDSLGVRYTMNWDNNKDFASFFVHRGHGLDVSKLFKFEDLGATNARVMLEELVHWDGNTVPNRCQFEYSSKEYHNACFVQALAHTLGYTSTIIPRNNEFGNWYKVSVLLNKQHSCTQQGYTLAPYTGRVMCLTVKSGMLMVRQRGSVSISGNCDAASLWKILQLYQKEEFKDYLPAITSLPHGASGAARDLARLAPKIRRHFKDITFVFDADEAGRLATEEACKVFPEATTVALPAKDANECIMKGLGKAAFKAVTFNAKKPKNTRLVWGRDVHDDAKKPAEWGLSFPWEGLTKITRGLRFGETYYFGAGEKLGKSELVNALTAHFIEEHDLKVMVAKPEEANNKTYKMVLSKIVGKIFHDPTKEFDPEAYEKGGDIIRDNLCMLNLYQHIDWETLKGDIIAATSEGVKLVIIDPITNLTNGMSNSDIDAHLKGVAQEAAAMAMDLDIAIMFFCHLNKPVKGATPWDRGGKITTDYFAGSSAMARSCNYAIGIQGNKDPELPPEERNIRDLVILADREFGESGTVRLYWDQNTSLFNEMKGG